MKFRNLVIMLFVVVPTSSVLAQDKHESISCHENDSATVYSAVEQMPSFPGGETKAMEFVVSNLRIAESAVKGKELGNDAAACFVVSKEGLVKDVKIVKGEGTLLADSLAAIVTRMPRWIPGKHKGKEVDVYYTLPLKVDWGMSE